MSRFVSAVASGVAYVVAPLLIAVSVPLMAAESSVRELSAAQAAKCRFVADNDCSTTKSEGDAFCREWHSKQAESAGADAMVLSESDTYVRQRPSLTGLKTVTTTKMKAGYYQCGFEPARPAPGMKGHIKKAMPERSIEQRLIMLNRLKEKQLISEEEYQSKRKQILDDL